MTNPVTAVPPRSFYGVPKLREVLKTSRLMTLESIGQSLQDEKHVVWKTCLPLKHRALLGPSQTWRVFKKQQAALEFACSKANGLMTFVYQETYEDRVFLVAHPTVFWYFDIKRNPMDRCSYEIIPEFSVCKLYFDLEFEKEFNRGKDGVQITETFIRIVNYYLDQEWGICTNRSNILDLDSTSEVKFSRHLIYQLPNAAFRDNYNVGNFVKIICGHLRDFIFQMPSCSTKSSTPNILKDLCCRRLLDRTSINELLVFDNKGNRKLFCDEAVYTKNRHFRLFGSSKRNKNTPLIVSQENQYTPLPSDVQLNLFLSSLITYYPPELSDLRLLEYGAPKINSSPAGDIRQIEHTVSNTGKSPHPAVDSFINSIVTPGRINQWFYYSSSNLLVYTIFGFRYCNNIGRQHRSNGIKFVVNLTDCIYYQKCFDPDCAGYRSNELKLPAEIASLYNQPSHTIEESETLESTSSCFGIQDEDLSQILDAVECAYFDDKIKPDAISSNNLQTEPRKLNNKEPAAVKHCRRTSNTGNRIEESQIRLDTLPTGEHFLNKESKIQFTSHKSLIPSRIHSSDTALCRRSHLTNKELIAVSLLNDVDVERSHTKSTRAVVKKYQPQFSNEELIGVLDAVEKSHTKGSQKVDTNLITKQHKSQFTNEELIGVLDAVEKSQNYHTCQTDSLCIIGPQQQLSRPTVEESQKNNSHKTDKSINLFTKQHKLQFTDQELIEAMNVVEDSKEMLVHNSQSSVHNNFDTDELMQMMDSIEESESNLMSKNKTGSTSSNDFLCDFPDFGISDAQLLSLVGVSNPNI